MPSPPVFVTGSSGFIGSHVIEQFLADGNRVRCLVRATSTLPPWLIHPDVEIVRGDILDAEVLTRSLVGVQTVVHLAGLTKAKRRQDFWRGNVEGTRSVMTAADRSGVQNFVFISSLAAVGPSTDGRLLDENAACVPITAYGDSKLEAERLLRSYRGSMRTTIVRPPAVYGPRDRDTLELFRAVSYGVKPSIGANDRRLSLIHAKDLAAGIVKIALDVGTAHETFFLTSAQPYLFSELMDILAEIVHRRPLTVRIPVSVLMGLAVVVEGVSKVLSKPAILSIDKARDMVQSYWVCSGEKAKNALGFEPTIALKDGLRSTYDWYKAEGWL